MRKHWQAKKQLRAFLESKQTWHLHDSESILEYEKHIQNLEDMLMVFVPKKFLENQLIQIK